MEFSQFSAFQGDVQIIGRQRLSGPMHFVFAHGWISSRRMWLEVMAGLPPEYSATAFDFRGCGESDRPQGGHTLEGYAGDLRAVLSAIDGPVTVVAHSMGARIAQFVATEPPSNLAGLVLLAPGVATETVVVPRHRELTVLACGSRRRIHAFQKGAMARELPETILDRLIEDALFAQREHWFGWYDEGRTLDFSDRLSTIRMPVHVIAGEKDPLIPIGRVQREVLDRIEGAVLHVAPNVGHNLAVEAPHDVLSVLERMPKPLQASRI